MQTRILRWIAFSIAVIALGQGCQLSRVLRSQEALAVGRRTLEREARQGWAAIDAHAPPEEIAERDRRHGRILKVEPLVLVELIQGAEGTHFDAIYRLSCERGQVDVDLCVIRAATGWKIHEMGSERDLREP